MKLDITKACANSLRSFTQNNYGIKLGASHAHEIVAAHFGYASRAALLADQEFPLSNLKDAEVIILNESKILVTKRLKTLDNHPLGLPPIKILSKSVYAPIVSEEPLSKRVWQDIHEMAITYARDRAFDNMKTMGMDPSELDWITNVAIQSTEAQLVISVTFDYPGMAKKPLRHATVKITLPRISGNIGYGVPQVLPTFYSGHMSDPDFRLRHGID